MTVHPHPPRTRTPRKDPVSPADRIAVFRRDMRCVAGLVDPDAGECRDLYGRVVPADDSRAWTIEHVLEKSRMGKRAESVPERMLTLCHGHTESGMHAGRVWNLSHKKALRAFLATMAES